MRKARIQLALFLVFLAALPAISHAAPTVVTNATVLMAGPMEDSALNFQVLLRIQHTNTTTGALVTRWYQAVSGGEKDILAVALSALSTGKKVRIRFDPLIGPGNPNQAVGSEFNPSLLNGIMLLN